MKRARDGWMGRGWARCRDAGLIWAAVICVVAVEGDRQSNAAAGKESAMQAPSSPYTSSGVLPVALTEASEASDDAPPASSGARPGQAPESLRTTVSRISDTAEEIRLVKDKSAIVRTNTPIARAGVASPDIADVQQVPNARELVITGRAFGSTQLVIWSGSGEQKTFNVVVEVDLPMLNDAVRRLSSLARVQTRMLSGTLVLSGRVPDALTAERVEALAKIVHPRVANQMTVGGTQQTVLRCTVAEVNRQATRDLSMNWAIGGADWTREFFFANNLGQLNPSVFGNNAQSNIDFHPPVGRHNNWLANPTYFRNSVSNGPAANLTFGFPRAQFQVFMQALRENSLLKVLAEPNVVAVNGQEATFLSGGEFPVPVAQGGAVAGAITIEYKKFGILLRFTPTILGNGRVRLRMAAEVSDLVPSSTGTAGGLPVFSLTTRRVESTVEAGNEQTFAIGGLLSERVQALSSKIPGLGDMPVLGALFSSVQYQRNETELVVLVTPELVEPMDANQVPPVPGGDLTSPSDYDLFLSGRLEGRPTEAQRFDRGRRGDAPEAVALGGESSAMELSLRGPWGTSDFEER